MWIGHHKEIRELTFRALAIRRSESIAEIRSDEGPALETSAPESLLQWPIHIINPVDKTKLSYLTILPPTQHHSFFRNVPPFREKKAY